MGSPVIWKSRKAKVLAPDGLISSASVLSKSSNYTLTDADDVILASDVITLTLPTAVGCTGRKYKIKKVDNDADLITLATTGGQTIGGLSTVILRLLNESITVISDGANWRIFNRYYPGEKVIAKYYGCTTQAITTSEVVVKNATSAIDSHSAYSTSTGLLTVPSGGDGDYEISAGYLTDSQTGTANNGILLVVYKNGSKVNGTGMAQWSRQSTGALNATASGSCTVTGVAAGDTLGVYIIRDSAAGSFTTISSNDYSWVCFRRIQ